MFVICEIFLKACIPGLVCSDSRDTSMDESSETTSVRAKEPDWGRYGLSEGVDVTPDDDLVHGPHDGEQNELFREDSVSDVTVSIYSLFLQVF